MRALLVILAVAVLALGCKMKCLDGSAAYFVCPDKTPEAPMAPLAEEAPPTVADCDKMLALAMRDGRMFSTNSPVRGLAALACYESLKVERPKPGAAPDPDVPDGSWTPKSDEDPATGIPRRALTALRYLKVPGCERDPTACVRECIQPVPCKLRDFKTE